MKVLVTGATGFIGRHLVPVLLERGHEVAVVGRDVERARGFAWFDSVRFVSCDIHRMDDRALELFGAQDIVVHLAWPGLPNYKAAFHVEENLPGDCRFLTSLIKKVTGRLLVAGTCAEYGLQSGCLTEEMPTYPANAYAQAKDSLRTVLQDFQGQYPFTLQWARLFYMYGPGQNPNSLLAQLDRAIDSGEPEFNMSGGEQLRDYLPVQEVARRLVALADHPACAGVVNVCSGEPVSVRNLVERHLAQRGATLSLNLGHYPYADDEPMAFWGGTEKYRRFCGHV
ncbi:NAD-dependent epimerase/dehydratase family protein [Noviherbaspirillum denitrificans]|uniref:Epimerase n=1 Tax=Noviherbaspirillum denitrificans TaxID=1968433 RepID=A0A254TL14_9BURK|nr:NAD(P)-dependent oxidoreductase [Noviherbaspirillum denitrificans]OWW21303.1 epimerase [Noviherbaspirillum denitrificans]